MSTTLSLNHVDLLSHVSLFAQLDRITLAQLAAFLEPVEVHHGAPVCRQGDAPDGLYIVAHGRFDVYVSSEGSDAETLVGTLKPGDAFGEMGLLADEPRSATVRSHGSGEVLWLERTKFNELLDRKPGIARAIAATLSHRLQETNRSVYHGDQAIAREVQQLLTRVPAERRLRVLQASLLADVSPTTLEVVFGPDTAAVTLDLAGLVGETETLPIGVQTALARQLEREVGADAVAVFAERAAQQFASVQRWEHALELVSRRGTRRAFIGMLAWALRAEPPLAREQAIRWAERLTDDEAIEDPKLALARAAHYEQRGDASTALGLLSRAQSSALAEREAESRQVLNAEAARLASVAALRGRGDLSGVDLDLDLDFRAILERLGKQSRKRWLALLLVLGFLGTAIAFGRGRPQEVFLLLLAAAMVLWLIDIFPKFVVGVGLVAGWVLFGIAKPTQAAAGFASMEWMFIVAVLGIAAAIARSGLLFRVGLLLVHRLPRGLARQAGALMMTGVVLSPLLPHPHGRVALTQPLALAVAQAMRLKDREPTAAILGLAAWIGAGPMMFLFLNGSSLTLLVWGLLPDATRTHFNWIQWFLAAAPLGLLISLGAMAVLFLALRPDVDKSASRERVVTQLAVLGPPTFREVAMVVVLLLTIVGSILAPQLGLDLGTVAVLGLLGATVTGNFDRHAFQELDWDFLVFSGVALSIGALVHSLHIDESVAEVITHELGVLSAQLGGAAISPLVFVLGVAVVNLLLRIVIEQIEVTFLLVLALVPVAPTLGVDPWVVVVTVLATSAMWFFPDETHAYVVALESSEERLFSHAQGRKVAYGYAAVTLLALALSMPYWSMLGLV